jgi:hypothetical protein
MCPIHHPPGRRERRSEERLRQATFRLRVYVWQSMAEEEPLAGFCFLSEFSPSGAGLFLEKELAPASFVRLAFESVDGPTYRASVVWANRFALRQQFVGHEALSYRVGVRFQFVSEAERQRYLKYLEELKGRALLIESGMKF